MSREAIEKGVQGWANGLVAKTLAKRPERKPEFLTSSGTLTCKECDAEMHMTKSSRIPPCPKCHKTVFRKSY